MENRFIKWYNTILTKDKYGHPSLRNKDIFWGWVVFFVNFIFIFILGRYIGYL